VNRLCADNRLIRELTNWKTAVPFRTGLENTVRWIEKNLSHFDVTGYAK
jgi:hypothetical protein